MAWRDGIAGRSTLRALLSIGVALGVGCDSATKDTSVPKPPAALVAESHVTCAPWSAPRLSADGAFDLVIASDGPMLLWSPFGAASPPVIMAQRLDREGSADEAVQTLELSATEPAVIEELAAAAAAGGIGVAWVAGLGSRANVFQAHGSDRSVSLLTPQLLGIAEASEATRGRVLVAAGEDGELQVTWRGERSRCEAQVGTCTHYSRRSLKQGMAGDRGTITREMLAPCDPMLIGSLWADGSWYEGVCHRSPDPVAYVFSFRPAISYAEADDIFVGCHSFALTRSRIGAALWAECSDGAAVATRSHQPEFNRTLRRVTRSVRCDEGRPVLVAHGEGGVNEVPLTVPTDALGPALPTLPFGARAVWTGTHVVAAYVEQGSLQLTRGACRHATFEWCGAGVRP